MRLRWFAIPTVMILSFALSARAETPAVDTQPALPAAARLGSAAPPTPRPAAVLPKKGRFPLAPWSYAKAYTYNFSDRGEAGADQPEARNAARLVSPAGAWNDEIRSERLLPRTLANRAAALVNKVHGTYVSSKCVFTPRHAVAYFDDQDKPVAVVEVCFQCGDLVAWPDVEKPKSMYTPEGYYSESYMKAGEAAIAAFKTFFGKNLGEPLKWTDASPSGSRAP